MYPKTWELMEWSWRPTSEGPMGYTNSGVSKMGNLKIIRLTSFHGKPMVFGYPLFKETPNWFCGDSLQFEANGYGKWVKLWPCWLFRLGFNHQELWIYSNVIYSNVDMEKKLISFL